MDEEYMIKMAEEKGIFGDKSPGPNPDSVELKRKGQSVKPSSGSGRVRDEDREMSSDGERHKFNEVIKKLR